MLLNYYIHFLNRTLKLTESIKEVRFFNPVGFYHSPYLTGGFKDLDYYLKVNNISSTFTRNEQTRVMMRGLYLYCLDGTRSHYYLQIPVEDKTKVRKYSMIFGSTIQ